MPKSHTHKIKRYRKKESKRYKCRNRLGYVLSKKQKGIRRTKRYNKYTNRLEGGNGDALRQAVRDGNLSKCKELLKQPDISINEIKNGIPR